MSLCQIIFVREKSDEKNMEKDFRWLTFQFINSIDFSRKCFLMSTFKLFWNPVRKSYTIPEKNVSDRKERKRKYYQNILWLNYFVWFMLHLFTFIPSTLFMSSQSETKTQDNVMKEVWARKKEFLKKPHWIFHSPDKPQKSEKLK